MRNKLKKYHSDINYLDTDEIKKFFSVIRDPRNLLIFRLLLNYGLRVSEMINLKVSDINLDSNTIRIQPLKQKAIGKITFPMDVKLKSLIEYWLKNRPASYGSRNLIVIKYRRGNSWKVKPVSRQWVNELVKKYCTLAGIDEDKAHTHIFRHSFAMFCAKKGMNIEVTQKLLRHSDLRSTQVYHKVLDSERNRVSLSLTDQLNQL